AAAAAGGPAVVIPHTVRSLDRALEEAGSSGILCLSGRKLRDFPGSGYDLSDTTQAGGGRGGGRSAGLRWGEGGAVRGDASLRFVAHRRFVTRRSPEGCPCVCPRDAVPSGCGARGALRGLLATGLLSAYRVE
uniref:Uncharacterized protein n=1 Tax=Pavo cristatus TaxID=9049 RepID=A0A8C9L3K8_PAVCR